LSVPAVASAQQVANTKHDLSITAPTGIKKYNQICVYCHTPHGANTTISAPLWNHGASAAAYTMYTSAISATMDMIVGATPGPVSKACLSCHDGTIGLDVITNLPNQAYDTLTNTVKIAAGSLIGTDLTDDHPIAVTYDITKDAAFVAIATVKTAGLRFYGTGANQVECATCHNVHTSQIAPFLRKSNTNSALCLTCHVK
jgi:predicted CXXCH cytochrome family protein